MFISRFNRFFDRHSRIIYIGLGVVISLSFVVFVIPGSMTDLFGGGRRRGGNVGRMYGKTIGYDEFMRQLQLVDLANFMRTGEFMSQDSDKTAQLFQETLRRMRALREARERGLDVVSREEIADVIQQIFARDGRFDRELFEGFKQNVLYRRGLDGGHLDEALRQNIIVSRLDADISGAIYVSPNEAREIFEQFSEEFVIKTASFRANLSEHGDPTEAEIQTYFDDHREQLRGPDKRRVRVAQFTAMAFTDDITVSEDEIKTYYERLKETSMKDRSLEDATPDIRDMITQQKGRKQAGEAARVLATEVADLVSADMTAESRAEAFQKAAEARGATVKDSGVFEETGVVPNIGKFPIFQRRAYAITAENPVSDLIYDAGRYFVVCWLETIPGDMPETLDDDVRRKVVEKILEAEAEALYAEKVEPYREPLQACETAWELTDWYDRKLDEEADLDEDEKAARRDAFRDQIRTYISPYFVQRQKKVRVVTFNPDVFKPAVAVSEDDITAYYEENRASYQKEEVRARQILVRVPPTASAEEKAEKRAVLDQALAEVREGTPFAEAAATYSEDSATRAQGGDLGFFARGEKAETVDNAAFAMAPGQVSDILETPMGLVLLKLEEKRAGKSLSDVREEIRTRLVETGAEEKAMAAARQFAERAQEDVLKARGSGAVPADVFQRIADQEEVETKDTEFFSNRGVITPFGYEPELSGSAFELTLERPVSDPVKGRKNIFVACWLDTKDPELPTLDNNESLLKRVVTRVKRDRALAVARANAAEAYSTLIQALEGGTPFESAAEHLEDVEFVATEPFARNQPPNNIPQAREIVGKLDEAEPGTLLEPLEDSNGAMLVYVVSRTLPPEEEFVEQQERFLNQVRWTKRYAIVQNFYETLEKESNTVLFEPWRSQIEDARPLR